MRPAFSVSLVLLVALISPSGGARFEALAAAESNEALLTIRSRKLGRELKLDGIFYETSAGRQMLPREFTLRATNTRGSRRSARMGDGRLVTLSVQPAGANHFNLQISAEPGSDIMKWGLAIEALGDEYYTGLMERVVDGPQRASWAPGIKEAMDLRGQKVEMVVKPTRREVTTSPARSALGTATTIRWLTSRTRRPGSTGKTESQNWPDLSKLDAAVKEWFERSKH